MRSIVLSNGELAVALDAAAPSLRAGLGEEGEQKLRVVGMDEHVLEPAAGQVLDSSAPDVPVGTAKSLARPRGGRAPEHGRCLRGALRGALVEPRQRSLALLGSGRAFPQPKIRRARGLPIQLQWST